MLTLPTFYIRNTLQLISPSHSVRSYLFLCFIIWDIKREPGVAKFCRAARLVSDVCECTTAITIRVTPSTIQYNTIQYNTIQYDTIQYNTIQYNTIQYDTIRYNTIQYNTIRYNTIQYNTIQCNTIQYSTIQSIYLLGQATGISNRTGFIRITSNSRQDRRTDGRTHTDGKPRFGNGSQNLCQTISTCGQTPWSSKSFLIFSVTF